MALVRVNAVGLKKTKARLRDIKARSKQAIGRTSPAGIRHLRDTIDRFFTRQGGPDGPWQPLSDYTIAQKGHARILEDTHRLEESLTRTTPDSIIRVTDSSLDFGTRVPYAIEHERGDHVPRRGFMPYGEQVSTFFARRSAEYILRYPPGSISPFR